MEKKILYPTLNITSHHDIIVYFSNAKNLLLIKEKSFLLICMGGGGGGVLYLECMREGLMFRMLNRWASTWGLYFWLYNVQGLQYLLSAYG